MVRMPRVMLSTYATGAVVVVVALATLGMLVEWVWDAVGLVVGFSMGAFVLVWGSADPGEEPHPWLQYLLGVATVEAATLTAVGTFFATGAAFTLATSDDPEAGWANVLLVAGLIILGIGLLGLLSTYRVLRGGRFALAACSFMQLVVGIAAGLILWAALHEPDPRYAALGIALLAVSLTAAAAALSPRTRRWVARRATYLHLVRPTRPHAAAGASPQRRP